MKKLQIHQKNYLIERLEGIRLELLEILNSQLFPEGFKTTQENLCIYELQIPLSY